jgi:hypothetical protein
MAAVFCAVSWDDACGVAMVKERLSNRDCPSEIVQKSKGFTTEDTGGHRGLETAVEQELAVAFGTEDRRLYGFGLDRA